MPGRPVVIVGRHAADRAPDGLVSAWSGDLSGDLPTQVLPQVEERPLHRSFAAATRPQLMQIFEGLRRIL